MIGDRKMKMGMKDAERGSDKAIIYIADGDDDESPSYWLHWTILPPHKPDPVIFRLVKTDS